MSADVAETEVGVIVGIVVVPVTVIPCRAEGIIAGEADDVQKE